MTKPFDRAALTDGPAIVANMVDDMVRIAQERESVTTDDLRRLGWTPQQLDDHGFAATAKAAALQEAHAQRAPAARRRHPAERDARIADAHEMA